MIRLRVSTLESFRRVLATDYDSEAELAERLRRGQWTEGPASWQMQAGTAWHALLAEPWGPVGDIDPEDRTEEGELSFSTEDINNSKVYIGPGLCEVRGRKVFEVQHQRVEIEGTVDHIRGLDIQDAKTKFSTPDARDYEQSLQWRFYLAIHQGVSFRYNLFHFKDPDKDGFCALKDITSFKFWPYVGMDSDLREWIGLFLDWASDRKLLKLLDLTSRAA